MFNWNGEWVARYRNYCYTVKVVATEAGRLQGWVTNYFFILTRNVSVDLLFYMWNYKIAMAIFCASQFQDGDEVLKFNE